MQNRVKPRIDCPKCQKPFRTQWASAAADLELPRGPAVSEKFEAGRNFSNKLWNATRFVLMNFEGYSAGPLAGVDDVTALPLDVTALPLDIAALPLEDRWLLSRLASVARDATKAIDEFKFAELARVLYAFAWDEYCSAYLELCKARLADPARRDQARGMLLLGLDTILRLLHPIMPFVTEEIWQHLHAAAGGRRMPWDDASRPLPGSLMVAAWPKTPDTWIDSRTETQFGTFLAVVAAIREVRSRQNVPPKTRLTAAVRAPAEIAALLDPMRSSIESMAAADIAGLGPDASAPPSAATSTAAGCDVFVDLAGLVDVDAEIARLLKENEKTEGFIAAKQSKLANESFVSRAPDPVIAKERAQLAELEDKLAKALAALEDLRRRRV